MTNQEIILTGDVAAYNPFRQDIVKLQKQNELVAFDYTTKKGIEEAKSYIYQLRKSRAAVEKTRKEEKASSLEYGRKVDGEAKQISEIIDKMIEVHQKPIDEIEEREKSRVATIRGRIDVLAGYTLQATGDSASLYDLLETVTNHVVDDSYQEFELEARRAKESTIKFLEDTLVSVLAAEHLAEENERLRKEAEERERVERERIIAEEAAKRAREEAERAAQLEKYALEEAARKEREESQRKEFEQMLLLEKAQREAEDAERRARDAERIEREKIAAEQKRIDEERVAREKQVEHVKTINRAILDALSSECGIDEEAGKKIVIAVRKNLIPNVTINY